MRNYNVFYITQKRDAWWEVMVNGNVGEVTIENKLWQVDIGGSIVTTDSFLSLVEFIDDDMRQVFKQKQTNN